MWRGLGKRKRAQKIAQLLRVSQTKGRRTSDEEMKNQTSDIANVKADFSITLALSFEIENTPAPLLYISRAFWGEESRALLGT